MRDSIDRTVAALRPGHRARIGDDPADDAHGLRAAVPGDRGSPVRPREPRLAGVVPEAGLAHPHPGTVRGGRQRTSGRGHPDGGDLGPARRDVGAGGFRFDEAVAAGGYRWWYLDAISDDGRNALTLIAFVGSVFSPYYAWRRRRGTADPQEHVAINVALYPPQGGCWTMTERGSRQLDRSVAALEIGPSALYWDGRRLTAELDERASPLPRRVRGRITVEPSAVTGHRFALDDAGRHHWSPVAPHARVSVRFDEPRLAWSGTGYCDTNSGVEPLEDAFVRWQWSRAARRDGAAVLYDAVPRTGVPRTLALHFDGAGGISEVEPPPVARLPRSRWHLDRSTRAHGSAELLRTLEDGPFYARSLVKSELEGEPLCWVHESLSLDRFRSGWVQWMLPFRMPRRAG
jgi:carotenoid 1,2-hydratase